MKNANWPIRVGGIYRCSNPANSYSARVLAIDGDTIYRALLTRFSDGTIHEHDAEGMSDWLFRSLYLPEDQSPIPALVEALKAARATIIAEHGQRIYEVNFPTIDAAIAKAEGRSAASPEPHPVGTEGEVSRG